MENNFVLSDLEIGTLRQLLAINPEDIQKEIEQREKQEKLLKESGISRAALSREACDYHEISDHWWMSLEELQGVYYEIKGWLDDGTYSLAEISEAYPNYAKAIKVFG